MNETTCRRTVKQGRSRCCRWLVAALMAAASTAVVAREKPRIDVRPGDPGPRVEVVTKGHDGESRRTFLRHAEDSVRLVDAGWSPDGSAAFLTWSEGSSATWTSFSTDEGVSWSTAQRLGRQLRLRDAAVAPAAPMPAVDLRLASSRQSRVFVVQLNTVSVPAFRSALAGAGTRVLGFFPDNAHLVRIPAGRLEAVRALDFVARIEPYHPAYRLDASLRDWLFDGGAGDDRIRVQVVLFEPMTRGTSSIERFAARLGVEPVGPDRPSRVIEMDVDRGQLLQLVGHDAVQWIGPWTSPESSLDLVRSDSGAAYVEDTLGYCGSGVRGEVLDNGIFLEHEAFGTIVLNGTVGLDAAPPTQRLQHGTNTFGIVFSQSSDGAHPDARGLLACAEEGIVGDYLQPVPLMDHAAVLKNDLQGSFLSKSFGAVRIPQYDANSVYIDEIAWQLDLAITQAQGNTASENSHPEAWAKNVISVGAVRHMDTIAEPAPPAGLLEPDDDQWCGTVECEMLPIAECSDHAHCKIFESGICGPNGCLQDCVTSCASIGPAEDGRVKPDVHYWYDAIWTTRHTKNASGVRISTYGNFGGTSAATPTVAGVLGLYLEMWADDVWGTDPQGSSVFEKQPHASTIKALLINNSQQYPFSGTGDDLTRAHQGWGRPNVRYAYERAARSFIVDETVPLIVSESAEFEVRVHPNESELKVTLVYPDPPGAPSASRHTVNNLDLIVTSPKGVVYHGNHGLDTGPYSLAGGTPDPQAVDNVENVFIATPKKGKWTVKVQASEVNQDGHPSSPEDDVVFALVVTGADLQGACADDADCDDGLFCNGAEICNDGVCIQPNQVPCAPGETCFEYLGECKLISSCPANHGCGGSECQRAVPVDCSTYSTGLTECNDDGTVVDCPGGIWITNCACEAVQPGYICLNQDQSWECR